MDRLTDLGTLPETAVKIAQKRGFSKIALNYQSGNHQFEKELEAIIVSAYLSSKKFSLKSKHATNAELTLILTLQNADQMGLAEEHVNTALAIAKGCEWARELVLLPPNLKKPQHLAQQIFERFSALPDFSETLFPRSSLEAVGAGGILGVGGAGEPVLVKLAYTGPQTEGKERQRIAIVGKV